MEQSREQQVCGVCRLRPLPGSHGRKLRLAGRERHFARVPPPDKPGRQTLRGGEGERCLPGFRVHLEAFFEEATEQTSYEVGLLGRAKAYFCLNPLRTAPTFMGTNYLDLLWDQVRTSRGLLAFFLGGG